MTTNNQPASARSFYIFSDKKALISAAVLVIFHAVGFWGLIFSGRTAYFQNLTPLNLMLTSFLLFLNHKRFNSRFFLFTFLTFTAGFLAEVLGVNTGFPFGNYIYGNALGFKVLKVPLLIGLNWLILVYSTGCMVNRLKMPGMLKVMLAALLMVFLDFFIEPAAIRFDFWHWTDGAIPWRNYAGWFALALLLQLCFRKAGINTDNLLAPVVWLVQLLFFVALNLYS